jgi:cysteine-rich repeat protein
VCSFRAALEEADAHGGADAIVLPPGTFRAAPIRIHDALIISGAGADGTTIDGGGSDTTITIDPVALTLIGVTVSGGNGLNVGGGISNNGGRLTLIDCTVRGNHAGNVGGGVYNNEGSVLTMIGTTVYDNSAGNVGGGVHNEGTAELTNCTISGNRAFNTSGGIGNEGQMALNNCTVADNICGNTGAGIDNQFDSASPLVLSNTIVAGNYRVTWNPFTGEISGHDPQDCIGILDSHGYNLIQKVDVQCAYPFDATSRLGYDPLLGPLADNGGTTSTHALPPGSPAIDAANPAPPASGPGTCAASDQRAEARPQGSACDIGAYEASPCGNGVLDGGEACDDGNQIDGDGCDANCTPTGCGNGIQTDGEECDDGNVNDGDCCSSSCVLTVDDGMQPADPAGSKLSVLEAPSARLQWSWRGSGGTKADFGTPTQSTDYAFCLVDDSGGVPALVLSADAPAGGTCAGKACWRESGRGFTYGTRLVGPGSLAKIKLKATPSGTRISLRGAGKRLRVGRLPLGAPVRALLKRRDAGTSWGADFGRPETNAVEQFRATSN